MTAIELTDTAKAIRNEYMREYRKQHKDRINAYQRKRNAENPERLREYNKRYWEKKASMLKASAE